MIASIIVFAASVLVVGTDAPTVQATLDLARAGDTVLVPEGIWPGPVDVDRAVTLSSDGGVIDGGGRGTVVRISAPGARLLRLEVRNSGTDRRGPDSCVYIAPEAVGAVVEDSTLSECTFGIWVHEGRGVRVEGNRITGRRDIVHRSNRGNGIHLFDCSGVRVAGNRVEGSRDGIYVSATEDSLILDNEVSDLRYGIHYMYSWGNTVRGNIARRNITGLAMMSSNNLVVKENIATDNEAHGILFRDVQYSEISDNIVERNGEGLFFFSTLDNTLEGNRVAHNAIGARVWAGTERNVFRNNAFIGNEQQVYYVAAASQTWGDAEGGNYWSDYLGWDQDGDGRGDRPYKVDSFTAGLLYRFPAATLLMASPAIELLKRLEDQLPILAVPTVVDESPSLSIPHRGHVGPVPSDFRSETPSPPARREEGS